MELSSKKRQRTIKEIAIVLRTVYAYISTSLPSKEDQWTYNKITYFVCLCLLFLLIYNVFFSTYLNICDEYTCLNCIELEFYFANIH